MIICYINAETGISYIAFMLFNCPAGEIDASIEFAGCHSKFSAISEAPPKSIGACHCL